ncbi:hypothetical protein [Phytohabitans maris]|uniref:hypothetical protein n=1 Tax=Phytohabitans maris TaxID=3071409 RepID=UPI00280A9739|nr:hypothetical protein [Phytohabitans sp. ZYX-F-186]
MRSLAVPVPARIQAGFDTDPATVTWVLAAYPLSASVASPPPAPAAAPTPRR